MRLILALHLCSRLKIRREQEECCGLVLLLLGREGDFDAGSQESRPRAWVFSLRFRPLLTIFNRCSPTLQSHSEAQTPVTRYHNHLLQLGLCLKDFDIDLVEKKGVSRCWPRWFSEGCGFIYFGISEVLEELRGLERLNHLKTRPIPLMVSMHDNLDTLSAASLMRGTSINLNRVHYHRPWMR